MDGKTWSEIAWSGNSNGAGNRIEWEIELSGKSQLITMEWVGAGTSH